MVKFVFLGLFGALADAAITEADFVTNASNMYANCICPFMQSWNGESSRRNFNWDTYEIPIYNKEGRLCTLIKSKDKLSGPEEIDAFNLFNEETLKILCPGFQAASINRGMFADFLNSGPPPTPVPDQGFIDANTLNGYGCYCSSSSDWNFGRGQPVDPIDRICKQIQLGYKCASKYDEMDTPCDLSEQTYEIVRAAQFAEDRHKNCLFANNQMPDNLKNENWNVECAAAKCALESFFVDTLINGFTVPGSYQVDLDYVRNDIEYRDVNFDIHQGTFNYRQMCEPLGNRQPVVSCCGIYPERKPFFDTNMECCSELSYTVWESNLIIQGTGGGHCAENN